MSVYECQSCEEVMKIVCTEEVDHCPCCGIPDTMIPTEKEVPSTATTAENWTHEEEYDGCGATYSVTSDSPVEYCPNCNGQWG